MQMLKDRDFLSALMLLLLGGVIWGDSGSDVKDWIFPLLASYVALVIGALLLLRVLLGGVLDRAPDLIERLGEHRRVAIDLLVFSLVVLVYILVMKGLGFWLSSFLMVTATSLYLTMDRTRRNVITAILMPLAVCVIAYIVFIRIFYVPVPEATWWSGIG
jgi:lysylphosphatidylglycerol synthetase-like protein (DUF2156 family)